MNIMMLKIGILLAIMAPTVLLLIAGSAGRICRLVFGHVRAEQGSRMSRGDQLRRPGVFPRTPHIHSAEEAQAAAPLTMNERATRGYPKLR